MSTRTNCTQDAAVRLMYNMVCPTQETYDEMRS